MAAAAAARGEGEKRRFIDIYNGGSCVLVKHRKLFFFASGIELLVTVSTTTTSYIHNIMALLLGTTIARILKNACLAT